MFFKFYLLALTGLAMFAHAQDHIPMFRGKLMLQSQVDATKCITAVENKNGAAVVLRTCKGTDDQRWEFKNNAGKQVRVFGNKCLDVREGVNKDGTKLQIWGCGDTNTNTNQTWSYSKWVNTVQWLGKGKCIDLPSGNTAENTPIQIWGCNYDGKNANQVWYTGYHIDQLPAQSQSGQNGTNTCGSGSNNSGRCQTAWINSASDFCLFAPPEREAIGGSERRAVAYCTKKGRGTREIPSGTLKGVHFIKTKEFIQITGKGDFTKINVPAGDYGGEMDNRGADGKGNPIGGLLYGNTFAKNLQYHEWTTFLSDKEFCIRACIGKQAKRYCQHIYDEMGCWWNMPGNYGNGFETCTAEMPRLPMGEYLTTKNGVVGTSTFHQSQTKTRTAPPAHTPPASTCTPVSSVGLTPLRRDLGANPVDAHPPVITGGSTEL